jgi:hypothetical protein
MRGTDAFGGWQYIDIDTRLLKEQRRARARVHARGVCVHTHDIIAAGKRSRRRSRQFHSPQPSARPPSATASPNSALAGGSRGGRDANVAGTTREPRGVYASAGSSSSLCAYRDDGGGAGAALCEYGSGGNGAARGGGGARGGVAADGGGVAAGGGGGGAATGGGGACATTFPRVIAAEGATAALVVSPRAGNRSRLGGRRTRAAAGSVGVHVRQPLRLGAGAVVAAANASPAEDLAPPSALRATQQERPSSSVCCMRKCRKELSTLRSTTGSRGTSMAARRQRAAVECAAQRTDGGAPGERRATAVPTARMAPRPGAPRAAATRRCAARARARLLRVQERHARQRRARERAAQRCFVPPQGSAVRQQLDDEQRHKHAGEMRDCGECATTRR